MWTINSFAKSIYICFIDRLRFQDRIAKLKARIDELLRLHVTSEVNAVRRRIDETLHSYSSQVRLEAAGIDKLAVDLDAIRSDLKDVRTRIADKFV